jgi:hypothetical protein
MVNMVCKIGIGEFVPSNGNSPKKSHLNVDNPIKMRTGIFMMASELVGYASSAWLLMAFVSKQVAADVRLKYPQLQLRSLISSTARGTPLSA